MLAKGSLTIKLVTWRGVKSSYRKKKKNKARWKGLGHQCDASQRTSNSKFSHLRRSRTKLQEYIYDSYPRMRAYTQKKGIYIYIYDSYPKKKVYIYD